MTTSSTNALQTINDVRAKMRRSHWRNVRAILATTDALREMNTEDAQVLNVGVPEAPNITDTDKDIVVALPFHLWDTVKIALDWYEWAIGEAAEYGAAKNALHLDQPAAEEMSLTPQTNEPDPARTYTQD